MKVKATLFSSSDWDTFFQCWVQIQMQQVASSPWKFGRHSNFASVATFPWGFMTLCTWPMWRLHLGHLMPLAAGMEYDDSGRPWCFPDGSRTGHVIIALQLGNVMLGWWSGCWEEGSLTLNLVCSLFKFKDWINSHYMHIKSISCTHIYKHTYKINIIYTYKHTTPQLHRLLLLEFHVGFPWTYNF